MGDMFDWWPTAVGDLESFLGFLLASVGVAVVLVFLIWLGWFIVSRFDKR